MNSRRVSETMGVGSSSHDHGLPAITETPMANGHTATTQHQNRGDSFKIKGQPTVLPDISASGDAANNYYHNVRRILRCSSLWELRVLYIIMFMIWCTLYLVYDMVYLRLRCFYVIYVLR